MVHRSPHHVPGNQLRPDPVSEKLRDPYMTEEEAKSISSNGGVDMHAGTAGGLMAAADEVAPSATFEGAGVGGNGGAGGGNGSGTGEVDGSGVLAAGNTSAVGSSSGDIGGDRIPMDQVGAEEGKCCIVCGESFESEFDDATDQWVYKNIRRVPAGLLHATCWSVEAASLRAGNKRALDEGGGDGPEVKRARN